MENKLIFQCSIDMIKNIKTIAIRSLRKTERDKWNDKGESSNEDAPDYFKESLVRFKT